MNYETFLLLFDLNKGLFITIWLLTVLLYLIIYKRYIYSIIDPFLFHLILSASGYSIVVSLWYLNYINEYYFYNFLLNQMFFTIGFYFYKPVKMEKVQSLSFELNFVKICKFSKIIYILSGIIFIFTNYLFYYLRGIPLLMDSRLEATVGGFGIFQAIIQITTNIVLIFIIIKVFIYHKKLNILDLFFVANYMVYLFLSGSRAVILSFLFTFFYIVFFLEVKNKTNIFLRINRIKLYTLIILTILFSLLLFYITTKQNPIFALIFRILLTGDGYMMAYVNDNINIIEGDFFSHFFGPLLAGFKLLSWDEVPKNIGQQLFNYIYQTNLAAGPNARMEIIALKFFGEFSVLYSFLIGFIISFLRNKLVYLLKNNFLSILIYIYLVLPSLGLQTDIVYTLSVYKNFIVILPLLILISVVISLNISQKGGVNS